MSDSGDSSKFLGPPKVPPVTLNSSGVNQEDEEKSKQEAPKSSSAAPKKLTKNVGSATGKFLIFVIHNVPYN